MELKELANLIVKLAGALVVVFSLVAYPNFVAMFYGMDMPPIPAFGYAFISAGIPLLIGLLLWLLPTLVTNRIVLDVKKDPNVTGQLGTEFVKGALIVLGCYLLFRSLSDLSYHLVVMSNKQSVVLGLYAIDAETWGSLAATGIELAIAMTLVLWAPQIVAKIRSFHLKGE